MPQAESAPMAVLVVFRTFHNSDDRKRPNVDDPRKETLGVLPVDAATVLGVASRHPEVACRSGGEKAHNPSRVLRPPYSCSLPSCSSTPIVFTKCMTAEQRKVSLT